MTSRPADRDRGAALLLALLVALLLAALGGGLITVGETEAALAHHHRALGEVRYAADAAVERALTELRAVATWTDLLTGVMRSPVFSASPWPVTPWGSTLDLQALTAALQAESNATFAAGLNNPVWRVYASGSLDAIAGGPLAAASAYLIVWVADDTTEIDNDPSTDTNDVVLVRGLATNPLGMRAIVRVTAQRTVGSVRVLAWHWE